MAAPRLDLSDQPSRDFLVTPGKGGNRAGVLPAAGTGIKFFLDDFFDPYLHPHYNARVSMAESGLAIASLREQPTHKARNASSRPFQPLSLENVLCATHCVIGSR